MDQTLNIINRPVLAGLNFRSVLALAGIAGPVILVIADCVAGINAEHYNFIQNSISSLAWTKLGWVQTIGFLAIGLLVELFIAGLFFTVRGRRGFGIGIAILVFFGFDLLMIGAFHTDPSGGPHTFEGSIHGLSARSIFWLYPLGVLLIARSLKKDPRWKPLFIYSIAAAGLSLVLMLSSIWLDESSWFGLFERLLVANQIIWVEVLAIALLRLALKERKHIQRLAAAVY
jgi:hypothetical protein